MRFLESSRSACLRLRFYLANGQLNISDDLMIRGVNSGITIDGRDSSRIFNVNTTQRISFGGLTVVGGNAGQGGGIATAGGETTVLYQMNFSQNVATGTGGGAVFNAGSNLYVKNCVMDGNIANGPSDVSQNVPNDVNT